MSYYTTIKVEAPYTFLHSSRKNHIFADKSATLPLCKNKRFSSAGSSDAEYITETYPFWACDKCKEAYNKLTGSAL